METSTKAVSLTLMFLLAVASVMSIQTVFAAVPTPSVPEFTVQVLARPYDVAPVYSTDEYTGEKVLFQKGYHVENKSVEVQIKNQPYSYISENGTVHHLYYTVRIKGHFGNNWVEHYSNYKAMTYAADKTMYHEDGMFVGGTLQSDSQYTTLMFPMETHGNDAKVDVQVMASVGHDSHKIVNDNWHFMILEIWPSAEPAVLLDTTSTWSNSKTVNLEDNSTTTDTNTQTVAPTQNAEPTETTTQPDQQTGSTPEIDWEQTAIILLSAAVAVLGVGMIVLWRRKPIK